MWWLARAFWAVMFVFHTPALAAACGITSGGGFQLLRAGILFASAALFALKLVDVKWLRLPSDRRVWLALAVGIALLHAGAVSPDLIESPVELIAWMTLLVVSGIALFAIAFPFSELRRRARAAHGRLQVLLNRITSAEELFSLPPRDLRFVSVSSVVRPPPIH